MRIPAFLRAAAAALALPSTLLVAQQAPTTSAANPQATLPYGATSDTPVSRWTPPASAGRQLTLNDLLTWKGIRTPQLSNDGRWFAYVLAPNEGDAEVVIRPTSAGGKEWRFPVGSAPAPAGGRGGPAGPPPLVIAGNNKWVGFLVHASANAAGRGNDGFNSSSRNTFDNSATCAMGSTAEESNSLSNSTYPST